MATYDPFASVQDPTSLGLLGPFVDSPPTKEDEVLAATQEKVDMLKQLAAEHRQRLAEAKGTSIDTMGLTPGSTAGNIGNFVTSVGSSGLRMAGNALSMPFNIGTANYTNKLQPKDYEIFNKINKGKATPEEVAYFNAKQYDSDYGKMSPKDVFAQVQDLENIMSSIGDSQDYSMYVEQGARKVFDQELSDGGRADLASLRNSVEGMSSDTAPLAYKISNAISASASIGNLIANAVKVSADNPVATMEYMGEQIPMLGLGSAGLIGKIALTETTLGYAGEYYNKGMQAYKAKNGGEYPPEEQRAEMLRDAISLAGAEYVGTMLSVGAMGLNKAVTPLALMGKAAGTTAVKEAGELGLKAMLKGAGVGTLDVTKNVLKSTLGEAGTEGYQTYAEGQLLGKPASALEIYKGAAIGGLASGGITAPFATVAALTGNTEANVAKRKAKIAERKAVNDAILSGNADAFLDPQSKTYDLNKGMEILHGIVTNKDAAPDVRMEASNKAQAIYDDMQSRIAAAEELLNSKGLTPDVLKKMEGVPDYLNKAEADAEAILADRIAKGKDTTNIQGLLDRLNGFRTAMDDTEVQNAISTLAELPEKVKSIADTVTSINESNVKDSYEAYIAELQGTQDTPSTSDELVVKKGTSQDVVDLNAKARKEDEDRLQEVTTQISELEKTIAATTDADAKAVLEDGLQQAKANQIEAQNSLDWFYGADQQVSPSVTVKPGEAHYDDFKAVTEAYAKAEEENHAAWKAQDGTPEKEAAYNTSSDALTVAWEKRNTLTDLILAEKAKGKTTVSPEKISLIRSMGDLGSMTPEEALAIADDASVDLTEKERNYLRKFSAARVAYNAMQDVASVTRTVINGDKANKNKSITDYRNGIAQAIRENNFTHAMALQRGIEKWAANQLQRAKLGREALNARLDGSVKKQINIIRKTDNTWESTTDEWSDDDLRINGGFSVSKGSDVLINAIEIEADALQAASLETADMIAIGFDVATPVAATTDASISPNEAQQAPVEAEATQAPVVTETPVEQAPSAPMEVSPIPVRTYMPTPTKADTVEATKEQRTAEYQTRERAKEIYGGSGVLYSLSKGVSFLSGKFTQNKGNGATTKPLASVSNFFSAWKDTPSIIDEFMKEKDRTPEQNYALGVLLRKVTEWMPMIDGLLVKQDAKFESQYLYESFMLPVRENGEIVSYELEENVKAAIAYAVFSFIQNAGGMTYRRTPKEINALLQRQEDFPVSPAEYKKFSLIGERRGAVINDLGQRVVESLGVKANKDTPVVMDSRLQNQLGDIALRLMFEIGAVTGHTKTMRFESAKASAENFIRFANVTAKGTAADTENRMIAVSGQGSQSIVSKMMGVEEKVKEPSLKPVESTSADLGSKFQDSPSELLNTLNEENKIENFAYEEGFVVLDGIDTEYALEMMGKIVVDGNNKRTQKTKVLAIQAVNEGIERNWFGMKEFISKTLKNDFSVPFFLKNVPWSQNRAGIEQKIFNPQADKAGARFLMTRKEWQTTIDRNNTEEVNALLIAVALAMDIDIDKKSHEAALNDVTKALGLTIKDGIYTITNPVFSAAVEAIYDRIYSGVDLTDAEQRSIVDAVAKTKTGLHGLQGLIALANMLNAQRTDLDSFTVHLIAEADGVTNGSMLTNLLWGTYGTPAFLERGGFFGLNPQEQHKDHNVWRGVEGRNDLYEDNAKGMVEHLTRRMKAAGDTFKQQLNHVYYFTKPLIKADGTATSAARKIVKTPTTQFHFGSGMKTLVTGMFNELLSGMYDKMEDVANAEAGERAQAMQTLVTHINGLLPQGLKIDTTTKAYEEDRTKFWVEFEFSDKQLNAMASVFQDTLGDAIEATFDEKFKKVTKVKDAITTGSNLAFNIYNATYQYLRDMIGDSITFEQEEAIRERIKGMLPTVATQFSKESDNGADARIPMMGKRNRRESRRPGYRSVLRFKPFQLEDGTSLSTMTTYGYENLDDSPSVSMVAMPIHSLDSRTSHGAVKGTEALNIHDANLTGVGNIVDQAHRLNVSLWDALLEYSPVREVANGLMRTIQAIPVVVASMTKEEADAYISMLATHLKQPDPSRKANSKDAYAQIVESMAALYSYAAQADTQKLGFMANMAYLSQYAYEGGALEITDTMRQAASAKLMTVDKAFTPEQQQAILATKSLLQTKKDEADTAVVAPLDADLKAAKAAYFAFGNGERAGAIKALKTLLNPITDATILSVIEAIIALEKGDKTALAGIDVVSQITAFEHIVSELQTVKTNAAVWGELTTAPAKFPGLVAALSQPNVTKDSLVQALKTITSEDKISYFDMLLNSIMKIIPDFKVVYLTEDVKRSDVPFNVMAGNEFAQFVLDEGKATLYVRGHMYANSSVTPETILHELVHSALSATLVSKNQTDVQKAAIAEITKMYELAKVTLEAKYSRVFGSPDLTQNLDEFITYGITNEEFMTDLQGIAYTTEGLFKAFVRTVFKALGLTQDKLQTVFGALINNVSGLIAEQETNTTKAVSDTIIRSHSPAATVRKYTTVEIFDGLSKGTLQASFEAHLKGILNGIVNTLHGPFGTLAKAVADSSALSPLDVYSKAVNDQSFPFVSDIIASGFVVSEQEQFVAEQIEATVRAAIEDNEGHTTIAYTQLTRMFNEAYKKYPNAQAMLPNWSTATKTEQQRAEALHAFLFKVENGADGKSNHIARFAAMVLGVEEVNALFQYGSQNREATPVPTTFTERLLSWFNKVLNAFESRATKTYSGQKADVKMESLLKTLVGIEMKKRHRLMQPDKLGDLIEAGTEYLTNKGKQALYKFGNSRVFTKSKNAFVGALGTAVRVTAQDQVEAMLEATRKVYSKAGQHQYGLAMGVLNEMRGAVEATLPLHKLGRISKRLENRRKDIMTTVSNTVLASFGKRSFSKKESEAMTKYLIRSGAFMLLDTMSLEEIEKLFSDETYLKAEITKIEQALNGLKVKGIPGLANFYITTAKALGHSLMTEEDKTQHVLGNAIQISTLAGTEKSGKVPSAITTQAIPMIDKLATLQAILSGNVADQQREMVANIMREQLSRGDKGNGVHMTLLAHKHYIEEATKKMFKGKTYLVPKGFVPEVVNPHVEVFIGDVPQDKRFRQLGYSKSAPLELDKYYSLHDARIYSIKGSGMRPWLSGVFSYSGLSTRYVGKLMKRINPNTVSGHIEQVAVDNSIMLRSHYVNQLLSTAYTGFDPTVGTQLWARPTINDQMKIIDYKQVLPGHIKDSIQERNNNFSQLLGTLASNVFDSDSSLELNEKVVRELYDFYHANKAGDARSYVRISPLSSDPEIREIALKLPKETREAILKVWGPQGMLVRYDTLDLLFGYRKGSATDAVFRSADEGNYYAKVITDVFSIMFARTSHEGDRTIARERAQRWLNNVGDVWEEIVSETKDIIVMKTGIVLLNNITSNYFELIAYGLTPFEVWKYWRTAILGARAYHRDADKLAYLKHQLEVGYVRDEAETRRQIALLENDIARNPVSKLIEEGLMPTIVEDVASDEDSYSYKSGLTAKVNKHLDKHKTVQKVAKFVYMSRDGWMYQTLSSVTQHSDFIARYALYQHMTNKARNPMTHDAAIQLASDAFINYDIPSHRKLQWANDMGFVMFTKYLIRIQKVILHLARNHPLSSLTTLLLNQYIDALPMIYDSGMFGDSYGGGLLHAGALEYPGVVNNIATPRMLGL